MSLNCKVKTLLETVIFNIQATTGSSWRRMLLIFPVLLQVVQGAMTAAPTVLFQ